MIAWSTSQSKCHYNFTTEKKLQHAAIFWPVLSSFLPSSCPNFLKCYRRSLICCCCQKQADAAATDMINRYGNVVAVESKLLQKSSSYFFLIHNKSSSSLSIPLISSSFYTNFSSLSSESCNSYALIFRPVPPPSIFPSCLIIIIPCLLSIIFVFSFIVPIVYTWDYASLFSSSFYSACLSCPYL